MHGWRIREAIEDSVWGCHRSWDDAARSPMTISQKAPFSAGNTGAAITALKKRTGYGIVLNTSFNENDPVVDTPEQAIA